MMDNEDSAQKSNQVSSQQTQKKSCKHPKLPKKLTWFQLLQKKLALCKMRHSHQKSKTLADKSFKAAACWVTGTVVCCLCSSASTIYLYSCSEADWGCPFQIRLSLFIPVATASVMVSHFLTFISFR